MGDLMSNGSYPIIDESSCGYLRGMIQAVERLLGLVNANTLVVPGHGAIGNRQTLLSLRDMLRTIVDRVQSLLATQELLRAVRRAPPLARHGRGAAPRPPRCWARGGCPARAAHRAHRGQPLL